LEKSLHQIRHFLSFREGPLARICLFEFIVPQRIGQLELAEAMTKLQIYWIAFVGGHKYEMVLTGEFAQHEALPNTRPKFYDAVIVDYRQGYI
jgi:hypothetical protein